MRKLIQFSLLFLMMSSDTTFLCQEKADNAGGDDRASARAAYEKRKRELLLKLESIKLSIKSVNESAASEETPLTFQVGSRQTFRLTFTNTGTESIPLVFTNLYDQSRPRLFKDGKLVPYRGKVSKSLQLAEDSSRPFSSIPVLLEQNETKSVQIALSDWYDLLKEGRYKFIVSWRYFGGGGMD